MAPRKLMEMDEFMKNVIFSWTEYVGIENVMMAHDQGDTNLCWAFSTTDSLSVVDRLVDCNVNVCEKFSVQELMNFVHLRKKYQTRAFKLAPIVYLEGVFNSAYNALRYVEDNGICNEIDCKYVGEVDQDVSWDTRPMGMRKLFIRDVVEINGGERLDLFKIFKMLQDIGPLVGVVLECPSFNHIRDKLYKGPTRRERQRKRAATYHSILVVGYGIDGDTDFFLCKNSHGHQWGMEGFGKIAVTAVDEFYGPVGTYRDTKKRRF